VDLIKFQKSLYKKSLNNSSIKFDNLFNLICRKDILTEAYRQVSSNKGANTAGIDKVKTQHISSVSVSEFIDKLAFELKNGEFKPLPVKEVLIPKPKGGKRPLGIPAVKDRIVQAAIKCILEPIFEGTFSKYSFGFRPKKNTHQCMKLISNVTNNSSKMFYVIEGDIKSYFTSVNHSILLTFIRAKVQDKKLINLIRKFLKAGLMRKQLFVQTKEGVPQGGILSPLLANIYLNEIDKYFENKYLDKSSLERRNNRRNGIGNVVYTRYADDFVLLTNGSIDQAQGLLEECRQEMDRLKLTLSKKKTIITHVNKGFQFLGFQFKRSEGQKQKIMKVTVPKESIKKFKGKINACFDKSSQNRDIIGSIQAANRIIKGWGNYYKYCNSAKSIFNKLDSYIFEKCVDFVCRKHRKSTKQILSKQFKNGIEWEGYSLHKLQDLECGFYHKTIFSNYEPSKKGISESLIPDLNTYWVGNQSRGKDWTTIRLQVLERDCNQCQDCNKEITLNNSNVHHIKHYSKFRDNTQANQLSNLVALCITCHIKRHAKTE